MENREVINWLTRIRDRLMTTNSKQYEALTIAIADLEKQEQAENEWCPDCAEYDKENHCCHRFTKVIRQTVEECKREWANEGWIPVTERLPKKQTKVLVVDFGEVDTAYINSEGRWMDFYGDKLKDVTAWRLLPKPPYQEDKA